MPENVNNNTEISLIQGLTYQCLGVILESSSIVIHISLFS